MDTTGDNSQALTILIDDKSTISSPIKKKIRPGDMCITDDQSIKQQKFADYSDHFSDVDDDEVSHSSQDDDDTTTDS